MTYVFKVKVHADMTLDKFKARLCVVGSTYRDDETLARCSPRPSPRLCEAMHRIGR